MWLIFFFFWQKKSDRKAESFIQIETKEINPVTEQSLKKSILKFRRVDEPRIEHFDHDKNMKELREN